MLSWQWVAFLGEFMAAGCFIFYVAYQPNEGDH